MNSAVYRGWIRHRRFAPVRNDFAYRVFMLYLDLDELPGLFDGRWLWSARRFAPAWFRRADFLGDSRASLRDSVAKVIESHTGARPQGPIRLLTHLRYFGYSMNPVSFYYCFSKDEARVDTIIAEITNTPWRERHAYVLPSANNLDPRPDKFRFAFDKAFHVSPFMTMRQRYDWRFNAPASHLTVQMNNLEGDRTVLDATMALRREPMTSGSLARCLMRHPFMTLEVIAKIHFQAARLWWKGCPMHPHPGSAATVIVPGVNHTS